MMYIIDAYRGFKDGLVFLSAGDGALTEVRCSR